MIYDFTVSLFNSNILLMLTLLIVSLGLVYLYINQKIAQSEQKMAYVINAVKGLIGDMDVIKSRLFSEGGGQTETPSALMGGDDNEIRNGGVSDKIPVSDDEYDGDETDGDDDGDDNSTAGAVIHIIEMRGGVVEANDVLPQVVEELENVELTVDEVGEETKDEIAAKTTDIRKMPVAELRMIVGQRGLCEDPMKLKKPQLIELLETSQHIITSPADE